MKATLFTTILVSFSLALSAQAPPAGKMWPFEELPRDYLREEYGFDPDDAWLERVRLASLRYGGGSASFVSPRGLILTNHHVVRGQVEAMRHEGKNLNDHGYVAHSLEEELKVPGGSARQLVEMRDVTAAVFAGVDLDAPRDERQRQINANRQRVLAEARKEFPDHTPELITMFRGARVHLYVFKIYRDIRLVFSPHLAVGYFGGNPDNFSYPHYALDFALLRAYEDDFPADTSEFYLEWRAEPLKEGEVVLSSGNPGSTDRHLTVAEVEYQRDALYRARATATAAFRDTLIAFRRDNPEKGEGLRELEFSTVTGSKSLDGVYAGLQDPTRLAVERRFENAILDEVEAKESSHPRWAAAFEEIAAACEELENVYLRRWYRSAEYAPGRSFGPLQRALDLVEDLHPEFVGANHVRASSGALRFEFEPELMIGHLKRGRDVLGADDPGVAALLDGAEPEEAVRRWLEGSRMTEAAYVSELRKAGWEGLVASDDPLVRAAVAVYPLLAVDTEEQAFLQEAIREHELFVGQAIDAVTGPLVSPEATFTLRLSIGHVASYEQLGTIWPASTNFYGLFGRHHEFKGSPDFALPELWLEREKQIDLRKPLNVICTVDIIGGNSGSPLLDAEGRCVGTLFDGNFQMVENQFLYRDTRARAIAVEAAGILESLTKVYDAHDIADELLGEAGYQ